MFDVHWSSAKEDITYLICHMTSQENVIEWSCDIIDGSSLFYVTTL